MTADEINWRQKPHIQRLLVDSRRAATAPEENCLQNLMEARFRPSWL
jgi:hypothetical protein